MEIAFRDRGLRDICESETLLSQRFGEPLAGEVKRFLSDVRAAETIDDLLLDDPVEVGSSENSALEIALIGEARIIFCSNHARTIRHRDGSVDWSKVRRMQIISIDAFNV